MAVIVISVVALLMFAWFVATAPTPESAAGHEGVREDPEVVAARSLAGPADPNSESDGVPAPGEVGLTPPAR